MIKHATFTIERDFDAPVEKVFSAFSDFEKKKTWFKGPEGEDEQTMDFRIGGVEMSKGKIHGFEHEFNALYHDIVPNERIIYAYDMRVKGERISVSLASIEFEATNDKTRVLLTEQDMFLDGEDNVEGRMKGTEVLFDQLKEFLRKGDK